MDGGQNLKNNTRQKYWQKQSGWNRKGNNRTPLYHILRKFKETAPILTGITRSMIADSPEHIKESLIEIYNSSIAAADFPDNINIGKLIFIAKPGKDGKKRVEHYRPITVLEITGKILEKIINK